MHLLRLKYFLAVLESESFSEAAELLYTTQSAVSKQVMALEKELGVVLFDRSHRKIAPTGAARLIEPYARTILDSYHVLCSEVERHTRRLRVASIPILAQYGLTDAVSRFRQMHPEVELTVSEREGSTIPPLMDSGGCELAILRYLPEMSGRYDIIPLEEDTLVAALPAGHPLAGAEEIDLKQLAQEPFLLLDEGTLLFKLCVSACQSSGFSPRITYAGNRAEGILEFVAQGMGVSLVIQRAVQYYAVPGVIAVPLREPVKSTIVLASPRDCSRSPAAVAFWNFFKHDWPN